jgi:hypothetical protein
MTTPQLMPFFRALADFAAGTDTPSAFLERCLARLEAVARIKERWAAYEAGLNVLPDQNLASMRRFGEEVMPALRA